MSSHDKSLSLSGAALLAMHDRQRLKGASAAALKAFNPPISNTGGISGQSPEIKAKPPRMASQDDAPEPQNTPPDIRASRARQTTPRMQAFLRLWFWDWMRLTVQNPQTGKGTKSGPVMEDAAVATMTRWAVSQGLHCIGIGNGTDGYMAGGRFALSPVDKETVGGIRAGHKTNMPGLELTGADGACDALARSAVSLLGPVLLARADVSFDVSHAGLWDDLLAYTRGQTGQGAGRGLKPPTVIESETGRTIYWGSKDTRIKIYEKDLERVAKGKLAIEDADLNLVRIEVTFRPATKEKAAFAKLSPGEMLGTRRFVRRFVEDLGRMVGYTGKGDTMGETRVEAQPDAATIEDRASHVIKQAARTCIKAAASRIVHEQFDGDWHRAVIDPRELHARAVDLISDQIEDMGTATAFVIGAGLDEVREDEERATIMAAELSDWIAARQVEREEAQVRLAMAMVQNGAGVPSSSSGDDGTS